MRVLVVDDHVLFREGLVSLLASRTGFEVVGQAGSVNEAVEEVDRLKPDLVLMDYCLPDGTGLEATELILSKHQECKIVFLTMYEEDDNLFAAIRSGAKGYLLKNTPVAKLLACLQALELGEPAILPAMTARIFEDYARLSRPHSSSNDPFAALSTRELEVLRELTCGGTNEEIGKRLFLSENTVKHHVHSILQKLGLVGRKEAVLFAREHGMKV